MDYKKTGNFLKALRKECGYTQDDVAKKLMVSPKTISRWECGDGLPDINIISNVASIYNVTVDELLKGERNIVENDNIISNKIDKNISISNNIFKKFNIFLIISISILLTLSLLTLIISIFNLYLALSIQFISIIISIILFLIGRSEIKEELEFNTRIDNIFKNKYIKRILYFFDALCVALGLFGYIFIKITSNNVDNIIDTSDLIILEILLLLIYLIVRLPFLKYSNFNYLNNVIKIIIFTLPFLFLILSFRVSKIGGEDSKLVLFAYIHYTNSFNIYTAILIVAIITIIFLNILFFIKNKINLMLIPISLSILTVFLISIYLYFYPPLNEYNNKINLNVLFTFNFIILIIISIVLFVTYNKITKKEALKIQKVF